MNNESAYDSVMRFNDDTRITEDFGEGLIWRDKHKELCDAAAIANRRYDIQGYFITFWNIFIHLWFFVGSPFIAHYSHSMSTGLAFGIAPYFIMLIWTTIIARVDDMNWFILPAMLISPIGWLYFAFFGAITLAASF